MPFLNVRCSSFRNLADGETECGADRIFLVGENGQGKTNFLEALYFLCYGASFRGAVESMVPAAGAAGFGLGAAWIRSGADLDAGFPPETIAMTMAGGTKEIRLNGKPLRDRKDLVDHSPAVVFCHEDFTYASGDPERRRFFFDQSAGLISVAYIDALRAYRRVLKQRNAALKDNRIDLLEALDLQFAAAGLALVRFRHELHEGFARLFPDLYESVSLLDKRVEPTYRPSWPAGADEGAVAQHLAARRAGELVMGTSLSGPHRDRWGFACGGKDFTATASTGQLRLVSLVLRVVQADLFTARTGRRPVYLLDDVLLELDVGRRRRFLELLPGAGTGAQSFFTFLPEEPWREYADSATMVYGVHDGRLSR